MQSDHGRRRAPATAHLLALGHATVASRRAGGLVRGRRARARLARGARGCGARRRRPSCAATGPRHPVIREGRRARRRGRCRRPCSPPTTRWRSACSARSPRPAARCPRTSAWSASTTSRMPRTTCPPLTTVRQDFDALGERAVAALIGGDRRRRAEDRRCRPGSSCGRAPAADRRAQSGGEVPSGGSDSRNRSSRSRIPPHRPTPCTEALTRPRAPGRVGPGTARSHRSRPRTRRSRRCSRPRG